MKTFRNSAQLAVDATGAHHRRGTSLSEVLVSTLVMSIGVVALATLFPISVLRSIQASQLTNAANLRYNAEAQVRAVPELINIGTEWQPASAYAAGDVVVPPAGSDDRDRVYVCATAGTSGGAEPQWGRREGSTTTDGSAEWTTIIRQKYVVDPLGFMLVDESDPLNNAFRGTGLTGAKQHFGNIAGNPFRSNINRFPAFGLYRPGDSAAWNEYRAASASVLPDTWNIQAETLEIGAVDTTARTVDLNGIDYGQLSSAVSVGTPDLVPDRLVLMDETGRNSHVLSISGLTGITNGTQLGWPAGQSYPTTFTPVRARVESLERRYSYLLSVRRGGAGAAHIDCVIFFRRTYGVQDEQVYSAIFRKVDRGPDGQPGFASTDDNGDGTDDDAGELLWSGSDDKTRNFVIVQYDNTSNYKPFFKKGGFICDAQNLQWYRVTDVAESSTLLAPAAAIASVTPSGYEVDPVATNMNSFIRLTLDRNVVENSALDNTLQPVTITVGGIDTYGGAVLMRGIVDVFPLRPRTY